MELSLIGELSQKELEQFKTVCNHLLSRTFVTRTVYKQDGAYINNPEYTFLTIHHDKVRNYLSLLDWDLRQDGYNGYFYVQNSEEANRCTLNKTTTGILLALRWLYDENWERIGLNRDIMCTVRDVLEKCVSEYAILSSRPNMEEVKRSLKQLENHNVIQRIDGKFNSPSCKFAVLPTILTAVSGERLRSAVEAMKQNPPGAEEDVDDEELEESSAD